jgi:hypothetical protein
MSEEKFIPYKPVQIDVRESLYKSELYYQWLDSRRSVREFSSNRVPKEVIEHIIRSASTAPSGAHKQPWTFCAISNPKIKSEIRQAAEKEEYENYSSRMSEEWLEDLKPFATNWKKPFLEIAPWIIVVCSKSYDLGDNGENLNNYYVKESVGPGQRVVTRCYTECRPVRFDSYSKPNELFDEDSQPPQKRTPVSADPGWLPCRKLHGTGFAAQATGADFGVV